MSRLTKAILFGILIGIAGLATSPLTFMQSFEENAGLGMLFKLRGARPAPPDAVIISIDRESSERLNLPDNPDKWPRSLHARLTEILAREGAQVIAFDVHFLEPRSAGDDNLFALAQRKACNVVLCQPLKQRDIPLSSGQDADAASHAVVKVVEPLELFTRSAVATAPFTLARIPFKVSRYWTFEPEAGDSPAMPAAALQLYAMPVYRKFIDLLEKASPRQAGKLPRDGRSVVRSRGVAELMKRIREVFESDPGIAERMLREAESTAGDTKERGLIRSLVAMYSGTNNRYLDFYGPPGSVATIPYYRALQLGSRSSADTKPIDLKGKAVFVGLSEVLLAERKDSFYTVFSRANGTFIGGVEIMATAFSNLLTDTPLKPAGTFSYIFIILLWGIVAGILCLTLPLGAAALGIVGLCALYLTAAAYRFSAGHVWYPVVIPLFVQAPIAFVGAVVWNYIDVNRERRNIIKAFEHYLPKEVVNQLSKDIAHIQTDSRVVSGVCLFTDAQEYTTLSEILGPHELRGFMNRYYATMFKPVKDHGGFVSGVIGDSMLALWVAAAAGTNLQHNACSAALDINRELGLFKQKASDTVKIKTRIGLHYGQILLGNIGALDHYEYTPMGDIVNTASRIEGLNKYLGTRALASEDVVSRLEGFLMREVGKFRLKGKVKPIVIYELLDRQETAGEKQRSACAIFAQALSAFRKRYWDEAQEGFNRSAAILGEDGPSVFYTGLCEQYRTRPPDEPWDGVVHMDTK
jgi:adenylate cyclase